MCPGVQAPNQAHGLKPRNFARLGLTAALVVGSQFVAPPPAYAEGATTEEAPSGFERVFVTGSSPGAPSTAKLITLYSMYGLALGGLALGGVAYARHLEAAQATEEFLDAHQAPAPCFALTSRTCEELQRLRNDERQNETLAALSLAGTGLFILSGLLTAEQWDNVQPEFFASTRGAQIHVRITF